MFCNGWLLGHERAFLRRQFPVTSRPKHICEPEWYCPWSRGGAGIETEANGGALLTLETKNEGNYRAIPGFSFLRPKTVAPTCLPADSTPGYDGIGYLPDQQGRSVTAVTHRCDRPP
jgi:hypothetical protein